MASVLPEKLACSFWASCGFQPGQQAKLGKARRQGAAGAPEEARDVQLQQLRDFLQRGQEYAPGSDTRIWGSLICEVGGGLVGLAVVFRLGSNGEGASMWSCVMPRLCNGRELVQWKGR